MKTKSSTHCTMSSIFAWGLMCHVISLSICSIVVYDLYAKFYESLDAILVFQPFTNRPSKSPEFECFGILNVLAILTGVKKGRYVTLKYFNILKKVSRNHR